MMNTRVKGRSGRGTRRCGWGLFRLCVVLTCVLGLHAVTATSLPYGTLPTWEVTWTNSAGTLGHLATDAGHGGWKLLVQRDTTRWGRYSLTVGCKAQYGYGSGVVEGAGVLDMRGAISGLDPVGATNAVWKIGSIEAYAFLANDGGSPKVELPARQIKGIYTPGTLTGDGMKDFIHHDRGEPYPLVEYVKIDEPYVTSTPGWFFNGCRSMTNITFNCPLATSVGERILNCADNNADVSDWDLSSVKTVGVEAMGNWTKLKGFLSLPAVESISTAAFRNCAITGAVLGLNGNLTSVGISAFGSSKLQDVILGTAAVGRTFTICTNAFGGSALKRVWFNGTVQPNLIREAGAYSFGNAATPEGQITFYVRDVPDFAEILAEADADPNRLVAASRFNTAARQRVERFQGLAPTNGISILDPFFADTFHERVTVAASGEFPYDLGSYLPFPITVTASCSDQPDAAGRYSHFYRWDGAPVESERNAQLVFETPEEVGEMRACFAHDWIYDTAAGVISNGNWKIAVAVVNAAEHTLMVGRATADGVFSTAYTDVGGGVLDLNGAIRDADGQSWTLVKTKSYCFTRKRSFADYTAELLMTLPTVVVYPETLQSAEGDAFNFNQSRNWPLKEIICICPNYAGTLSLVINGPSLLSRMLFRVPKITEINTCCFWQNIVGDRTDFSEWDLSGVTKVGRQAFLSGTSATGTLRLPSLATMGYGNFNGFNHVQGLVLATNLTLTSVGTNCFVGCTALKDIVIGNAKTGCAIGETSFTGTTSPTNVTFLGTVNVSAADQVLAGVAATDGVKTAHLHVSPLQGWHAQAADLTAAERDGAATDVYGVYRAGSRKAYMHRFVSPFDPKGTVVIIR